MFCSHCGQELPDNAVFCSACGGAQAEQPQPVAKKKRLWWRWIAIPLAVVLVTTVTLVVLNNRTVAEIPNPQDFFGASGREESGGLDVNLRFEFPQDPTEMLEAYATCVAASNDGLHFYKSEGENVEYEFTYTGFWLGDSKPQLRIYNYGNDYYGTDSDNRNYVVIFRASSNFQWQPWEAFVPGEGIPQPSTPSLENLIPSLPTTTPAPVITGPTLPDPAAFLGGLKPVEDEPAEENGWHLYYRTQIDEGWTAAHEYVDLLKDPRFGFTLRESFDDTTLYLLSEYYFFDYTGKGDVQPVKDRYYHHGYVDYSADVFVWIQKNGRDEYTGISVYFSNDLEVKDLGDRSTTLPDYTEGSPDNGFSSNDPYIPDYAKLPCLTCDGDGDCTECGGYGTIKRYNGGGEYIDSMCPDCRGNGNCTACGGSGTR